MLKWLFNFVFLFTGYLSAQEYQLVDTFSYFNSSKWLINEYGFDGIGCNMTPENFAVQDNVLKIILDRNQNTSIYKPFAYNSSGIQGVAFYKYGYFTTRMKSDIIHGSVSSFFLINKWQPTDWIHKEIDIEFLGKNLEAVQLTTHLINTKTNSYQSSTITVPLQFSIDQAFHDFSILWTPDSVAWFADEKLLHVEKKFVPDEPLQIFMNHWNASASSSGIMDWLGGLINPNDLPSTVSYSQVKVQTLEQYNNRLNSLESFESSDIDVFPNPVINTLYVITPYSCNVSVYSVSGNQLLLLGLVNGRNEVDVSLLPSGVYFLKLNYKTEEVIRKFVVKR